MKNMDHFFKEKLQHHEVPVPDHIWDRIEAAQQLEKRKKRPFIFWLLGISAFLCLGAIYGFYTLHTTDSKSDKPHSHNMTADLNLQQNQSNSSNDTKQGTLHTQHNTTSGLMKNVHTKSNTISALPNKTLNSISSKTIIEKQPIQSPTKQLTYSERKRKIYTKKTNSKYSNTPIPYLETKNSQKEDLAKSSDVHERHIRVLDSENQNKLQKNNTLETIPIYTKENNTLSNISKLNLTPIRPVVECPEFNKRNHYFSIRAYHASNYMMKALTSRNVEGGQDYLKERLETEKARYSFSDGLLIDYHTGIGISLSSGIEYNQITESFKYLDQDSRKTKTVITIDTTYNNDGTFSTSRDTFRIDLKGVEYNSFTNRFRMINIPFQLGYEIEGERFDIGVRGGVNLNVYFKPTGRMLGSNGKPTYIQPEKADDEGTIFTKKATLSYEFMISLNYHLTSNFDLTVEPYFRNHIGSFTKTSYPIEQRYKVAGIRIGGRYKF